MCRDRELCTVKMTEGHMASTRLSIGDVISISHRFKLLNSLVTRIIPHLGNRFIRFSHSHMISQAISLIIQGGAHLLLAWFWRLPMLPMAQYPDPSGWSESSPTSAASPQRP